MPPPAVAADPYAQQPYAATPDQQLPYQQPGYGQQAAPYGQAMPYSQPGYGQPGYGQPGYGQPSYNPAGFVEDPGTDGFSIAALVCSIGGAVMILPVIGSILGVIFGIMGLNRIKVSGQKGHGMALAGLIIGAVGLLLGIIVIVVIVAFASANTTTTTTGW
jgi:hypothetical protein